MQDGMFKCLPYFQILGVSKCGTTDLYNRLTEHPDMIDCSWKVGSGATREGFEADVWGSGPATRLGWIEPKAAGMPRGLQLLKKRIGLCVAAQGTGGFKDVSSGATAFRRDVPM